MRSANNSEREEGTGGSRKGFMATLPTWLQTVIQLGLKTMGSTRGARSMELLETLSLGGKRQLMLVVCDGHRYLVGVGADSVSTITEVNPPSATVGASPVIENSSTLLTPQADQLYSQETRCN